MSGKRALAAGIAAAVLSTGAAQAAPELSVSTRLSDRREVAAGTRAYAVGFEDGGWYANGWHITGEMGGIWAPPQKLADGVWFKVGDQWLGQATRFVSGYGYTRYELPDAAGLHVARIDFAPDGRRAVVFGLRLTNPGSSELTTSVAVDAHSELMGAYPWGFSGVTPNAADNPPDTVELSGGALHFTDPSPYEAFVAAAAAPTGADTGAGFRGPQPGTVCHDGDTVAPSACDDGPFGRGAGGELRYDVSVPAGATTTLWVAVAATRDDLNAALADPAGDLATKIAAREQLQRHTQVSLPGDTLLQDAIDWGKQNLADLTQEASDLQIRWTDQGRQFPPPLGVVADARWFGAGYPDYPWIFATDGEYTDFAAVALGQFETAKDHLRTLRDISEILNGGSGIVVHEAVSDGSVWFGHDSRRPDGTNDFNTDETIKFPSAVALIWRWTGDNGFRDEMYDFARRNLHAVAERLDSDGDGWPEGSGNVERTGMGAEKLDNAVYFIRALGDLADMAASKRDKATYKWATAKARALRKAFESTWWYAPAGQYADSLIDPGNVQSFQKHWIGQVPMEAGIAAPSHAVTALAGRESSCYSGERPGNRGLFHTGCGGGADGKGDFEIFSLTTSIQAVGEGNYGRLGAGQQQRYTDANAETMFSEPATGGTPDEQPGAMPEIFPSTPQGDATLGIPPNIDRCWSCRSMFMQAWGNYGTAWSVVHQQLGVSPFMNARELDVVPQVPPGQPSVEGSDIRVGSGAVDVFASHAGTTYTTKVDATGVTLRRLVIGHTLPRGARVTGVTLDGTRVGDYDARTTTRGLEVTVHADPKAAHTLIVSTG